MKTIFSINFRGGFHLSETPSDILGIANSYEQVEAQSFHEWPRGYVHACRMYTKQCWTYYNPWDMPPMPALDFFQQGYGPFVDGHQPSYRIRMPRFFAVISQGISLALLCGIEQLAGYLGQGVQIVMLKEFMEVDEGKNWLDKRIHMILHSMGAYIMGTASPVVIPNVGCCTPPIIPLLSPDAGGIFSQSALLLPGSVPETHPQDEYMQVDFHTLPSMG